MGGAIAVTIKKLNGEVLRTARWTNPLPEWICSKDLLENPQKWQEDFLREWFRMKFDGISERFPGR